MDQTLGRVFFSFFLFLLARISTLSDLQHGATRKLEEDVSLNLLILLGVVCTYTYTAFGIWFYFDYVIYLSVVGFIPETV